MSEHDWRDEPRPCGPDRYRVAVVIGGVRLVSEETYTYPDAADRIAMIERETDAYVVAVRHDGSVVV